MNAGEPGKIDNYRVFELESNAIYIHKDLLERQIEVYWLSPTEGIGHLAAKEY